MATIIATNFTSYQKIRESLDNLIVEYRDFAANGVPNNPSNRSTYLAKTSGSSFIAGNLYVFFESIYYEASPPKGAIFSDGNNLYQIKKDSSVITLTNDIYETITGTLNMNNKPINNITGLTAASGQDAILSSPILLSSYNLSSLSSTVNIGIGVLSGTINITGFTAQSSNLIGTINNTGSNIITITQNGIFSIHLDVSGYLASALRLELSNNTTGAILDNADNFTTGAGVGVNYVGFLSAGTNIRARINTNVSNTTIIITRLNIVRLC